VRVLTPCEYIAEWVARATEHLAPLPADDTVLVTHFWDAGIAGRRLATRFGATHVHVPHELAFEEYPTQPADGPAARNLVRRAHEERDVCRTAARVIATTPNQPELLTGPVYRLPAGKVDLLPDPPAAQDFIDAVTSTRSAHDPFEPSPLTRCADYGPVISRLHDRPQGVEGRLAGATFFENDSIL
jgi:mannosylfructose-phosphate synthase